MALIKCFECGNEIASSAKICPRCGAEQMGTISIFRKKAFYGFAAVGKVRVGSKLTKIIGNVPNGGSVEFQLPVGDHEILITSSVLAPIIIETKVEAGKNLKYNISIERLSWKVE